MTTHRPRISRAIYHASSLTVLSYSAAMLVRGHFDVRFLVLLVASAAVIFGGLGMRVHDVRRGTRGASKSMHAAVAILVLYLVGPWIATIAAAIASITYDLGRGRAGHRLLGNLPPRIVPITIAGVTWLHVGTAGVASIQLPQDYLPLVLSAAVFAVVNELCFVWDTVSSTDHNAVRWRDEIDRFPGNLLTTGLECLVGAGVAALCISNPWAAPVVLPMAASMYLALERGNRVQEVTERALDTFATIVDERDRYTFEHSDRVCEYAMRMGERLGLTDRQLAGLYWTSRLHDLGKVAVDNSILNKPGRLDEAEFVVMQQHPEVSARILASFSFGEHDADVVRYHHERYDGRGYLGMAAEHVPLEAFIIAVADAFDAMTSDRPYRRALSTEIALEEIALGIGTQFHPDAARALLEEFDFDLEGRLRDLEEQIDAAGPDRRLRFDPGDDIRDVA